MSLSSLIVQREVASTREVEESLARQVLYGGDFLLNLFEIARPDEARIAELLAEVFTLEAVPAGELGIANERALAMVPVDMARRSVFLPMMVDGETLTLTVSEPLPTAVENELAFALGVRVVQRIAPAFRILQAIARDYAAPLDRRIERLLVRLANPNHDDQMDIDGGEPGLIDFSVRQPPRAPSLRPSPIPEPMPNVRTEEVRRPTNQGFPAVTPEMIAAALKAERMPSSKPSPRGTPSPAPVASRDVAVETPTLLQLDPEPSLVDAQPPAEPVSNVPPVVENAAKPGVLHVARAPRPPRRRRGPLVILAAQREMDDAPDRDTVLDVFFDFSRQYFDYSALFVVQADLAEGRDAFGEGASREKVSGIGVPLELPSVLQTARLQRTVVQTIPSSALDKELMADLGRARAGAATGTASEPSQVALVPIVVRERVVALLLGDNGEHGIDADSLGAVAGFAPSAVAAFERLIVKRKLASRGSVPPGVPQPQPQPAPAPGQAPPTLREGSAPPFQAADPSMQVAIPAPPAPPSDRFDDQPTPIAPPVVHLDIDDLTPIQSVDVILDSIELHSPAATRREGPPPTRTSAPPPPLPPAAIAANKRASEAPPPVTRRISEAPPSSRGDKISVAPRRPPSSHEMLNEELPSIIVDVDAEFGALVARYVDRGDEQDEAELLRQGARAMPAIMVVFPGAITLDDGRLAEMSTGGDEFEVPFRASECGPILHIVAGQRRVALPFVLQKADSVDEPTRFWGTFLLYELPYGESAGTLLSRLFDPSPRIRKVARFASRAVADQSPHLFLDALGKAARDPKTENKLRLQAIENLGQLRQAPAVPILLEIMALPNGSRDRDADAAPPSTNAVAVIEAAHAALVVLTRHDFATDPRAWMTWWNASSGRHRIEWLIDALASDTLDERKRAGEELKAITKEYFGFDPELARRDRERSQQRYRDWWTTEGRLRFRRD